MSQYLPVGRCSLQGHDVLGVLCKDMVSQYFLRVWCPLQRHGDSVFAWGRGGALCKDMMPQYLLGGWCFLPSHDVSVFAWG